MKRRVFFRLAGGAALLGPAAFLSGCSRDGGQGPVAVQWDRDVCARCGMVLGERNYAAQRRGPDGKPHLFDDFGCAVFYQNAKGWDDAQGEFWVADHRSGSWLDARRAVYVSGRRTPMAYGFGALAEGSPEGIPYAEARRQVLARGK